MADWCRHSQPAGFCGDCRSEAAPVIACECTALRARVAELEARERQHVATNSQAVSRCERMERERDEARAEVQGRDRRIESWSRQVRAAEDANRSILLRQQGLENELAAATLRAERAEAEVERLRADLREASEP